MEMFGQEFRGRFSEQRILDGVESACERLWKLRREHVDVASLIPEFYERGRMPMLPLKLMALTQNSIRRGVELADSMIRDANAFSYTPVWTSARSLFELASLNFDCYDKVYEVMANWDLKTYLDFNDHLDNVSLGFKSKEWHPGRHKGNLELQAKNILTIMQKIDKKHIPGFFSMYELLSEVAHPNYMGMAEAYQTTGTGLLTLDFIDDPARRNPEMVFIALDNAHGALEMLASAIEKFEAVFVAFSKLVAEKIPENREGGGTAEPGATPVSS